MKYEFLKLKNVILNKNLKFYLIEFIIIFVYLKVSFYDEDFTSLIFGVNKLVFFDQFRDLIKIIDITLLLYSSFNLFFL